jgi:hypothetical protein
MVNLDDLNLLEDLTLTENQQGQVKGGTSAISGATVFSDSTVIAGQSSNEPTSNRHVRHRMFALVDRTN